MESIISFFAGIIISFIQSTSYYGVFLLMTLESMLIPIPSEITMPFAGFLASTGQMNIYLLIFIGAFANLIGSILAYLIGFILQENLTRKVINKYGKYLLITEEDYNLSLKWFKKYGESIVFFSRLLPIIRTFISLPAGIAKMKLSKFSILTFLGSLIWSTVLVYIGYFLGANWNSIEIYYRQFEYIILGLILLLIFYYLYKKIKKINSQPYYSHKPQT